jgi:hypothetical protein
MAETIPTRKNERTKTSEVTPTPISIDSIRTFAIENISQTGADFVMSLNKTKCMTTGITFNATVAHSNHLYLCKIKMIRVHFSITAKDEIDSTVSAMFIDDSDQPISPLIFSPLPHKHKQSTSITCTKT